MRYRRTINRFIIPLIAAFIALAANRFVPGVKSTAGGEQLYYVKKVIDGDTVILADNDRVRYIGINTPEIKNRYKEKEEPYGPEAKEFNRTLVEDKWVKLEFDIEKRDRYGRLLAYVYAGDKFVNGMLIREGLAKAYPFEPNTKYKQRFRDYEKEAKDGRKGIWSL